MIIEKKALAKIDAYFKSLNTESMSSPHISGPLATPTLTELPYPPLPFRRLP